MFDSDFVEAERNDRTFCLVSEPCCREDSDECLQPIGRHVFPYQWSHDRLSTLLTPAAERAA
jgi:hypothetical protein